MIYTAADGQVFEAQDAKEYVDANKIQAAIDNVISVVSSTSSDISNKMTILGESSRDAIVVSGNDIAPSLEAISTGLNELDVTSQFDGLYDKAVSEYNNLQEQFNAEAKAKADAATAAYNARMSAY